MQFFRIRVKLIENNLSTFFPPFLDNFFKYDCLNTELRWAMKQTAYLLFKLILTAKS